MAKQNPMVVVLVDDNSDPILVVLSTSKFREAGVQIKLVGLSDQQIVTTKQDMNIGMDMSLTEVMKQIANIRAVVIPMNTAQLADPFAQLVQAVPASTLFLAFGRTINSYGLTNIEKFPFLKLQWEGYFNRVANNVKLEIYGK